MDIPSPTKCRAGHVASAVVACLLLGATEVSALDGELDASFGTGGVVITDMGPGGERPAAVGVQADGKIVVAGTVRQPASSDVGLVRYASDGSLDPGFGSSGIVHTDIDTYDGANDLVVQPDGKIVLLGVASASNSYGTAATLVRYDAMGAIDPTFGDMGVVADVFGQECHPLPRMAQQADGKLIIAGLVTNVGTNDDVAVVRLNPDGTVDSTFGVGGRVSSPLAGSWMDGAGAVAVQSDGRIVVAGGALTPSAHLILARYSSSGVLDPSFGMGGVVLDGTLLGARDVFVQGDGRIVVLAASNVSNGSFLVRYDSDGTRDASFGVNGKASAATTDLRASMQQADGKIVVVGSVADEALVARFDSNGAMDERFGDGGRLVVPYALGAHWAAAVDQQMDGRLVVAGGPDVFPTDEAAKVALFRLRNCPVVCPACEACDGVGGCIVGPRASCRVPTKTGKSTLILKKFSSPEKDRFKWSFGSGEATMASNLGSPTDADEYGTCVFDATGARIIDLVAPAGGLCGDTTCWKSIGDPTNPTGYQYKNRDGSPDGLTKIVARAGVAGKASAKAEAVGAGIGMPDLGSLSLPLTVQLQSMDNGCFEATFSDTGLRKMSPETLMIKSE